MSGIVGSYHNIRGSGVVAKLGTDGQLFTSAGAGVSQGFEAAAGGGGKIQQVIHTLKQDIYTLTTEDAWVDVTDMSCAITPSASDSTILVIVSMTGGTSAGVTPVLKVQRDIGGGGFSDCAKLCGAAAGSRKVATMGTFNTKDSGQIITCTMTGLDNPATTSAVTYQIQLYADNVSSTTVIGSSGCDDDVVGNSRCPNTITLMEVLA